MLALYKKVKIFWKCWRFMKMYAHYGNFGILWKSQRFIKISALLKRSALYENVSGLWKCWRPIQRDIKRWLPPYCLAWQTPQWLLSSALAGGSRPGGVVPSVCCWVPAIARPPVPEGLVSAGSGGGGLAEVALSPLLPDCRILGRWTQ